MKSQKATVKAPSPFIIRCHKANCKNYVTTSVDFVGGGAHDAPHRLVYEKLFAIMFENIAKPFLLD